MRADKIWIDGEFIDRDDANVHVSTHTLHYELRVFEGIKRCRCTKTARGMHEQYEPWLAYL